MEPTYVIGMEEIAWGTLLLAITMALHGLGMLGTLRVTTRLKGRLRQPPTLSVGLGVLILSSWLIAFVHLVEVSVWAGFFTWKHAMPNPSVAYYFALLDYTTLGSDYRLPQNWRLLAGMIAISGLMTFAWSTGVLLSLVQKFQDEELHRIAQRAEPGKKRDGNTPPPSQCE